MFIDNIRIYAQAGDGGDGAVSWRREKFEPRGGPDGGDGGAGGSAYLVADNSTDTLRQYYYDPKLIAANGKHGMGAKKTGKSGKDVVGRVPPGTMIYRLNIAPDIAVPTAEDFHLAEKTLIADLTADGQKFLICQGGSPGIGNWRFRSATNRAPEESTPGTPGDRGFFILEMRRIADVGLVGFPNAGKSTLLGKLSAAKPKVAAYPFTTLHPVIGVVEFDSGARCTVADVPGLIEGAHANRGLGHEFLRHITRCRLLLFVLDVAGSEARDPISDLKILRQEIKEYDPTLADYPWKIVANKIDLDGAQERLQQLKYAFPNRAIIPISATDDQGLDALKAVLENETAK